MPPTIAPATYDDLPEIQALLVTFGLPTDGLHDRVATTIVARTDGRVIGSAALEVYDDAGLLRSVVVDGTLQGQGLGQQLTEAALALAREQGIHAVYLLTETARGFFPRFGFQPVARVDVAPAVQQSVEFTSACPTSAQAMVHTLERV